MAKERREGTVLEQDWDVFCYLEASLKLHRCLTTFRESGDPADLDAGLALVDEVGSLLSRVREHFVIEV